MSTNIALVFILLSVVTIFSLTASADQIGRDDIPTSAPTQRFNVNSDGTVRDTATGLTWKKCAEGQSGINCTGIPTRFTWQQALQHANQAIFAGFNDWRLPDIKELHSLVELRCFEPATNVAIFSNASSSLFWSGSLATDFYNRGEIMIVNFADGAIDSREKDH